MTEVARHPDRRSTWLIWRDGKKVVIELASPGYERFAFRSKPRLQDIEALFQRMRRAAKAVGRL